jgi:predicted transcriptional regulator
MRRITLNVENHIVGMLLAGHICREIAREQGVTISTVNHFVEDERRRTPDFYEIRRLALKLKKHNMSLYDAYGGAKLLEKLNELGFHFKNSEPT